MHEIRAVAVVLGWVVLPGVQIGGLAMDDGRAVTVVQRPKSRAARYNIVCGCVDERFLVGE